MAKAKSSRTAAKKSKKSSSRSGAHKKKHPKKAKAKKVAKSSRKGAKARGRKLAEYNRLAKKIGKRAAHSRVYGKGKAKSKKKSAKSSRRPSAPRRRSYAKVRSADFMEVLHQIQASHGSMGLPATPSERALARTTIEMAKEAEHAYATTHTTSEERIRQQTAATVRHAKIAAAQKILAVEAAAARKAEIERRRAEAKAAVESYAARL